MTLAGFARGIFRYILRGAGIAVDVVCAVAVRRGCPALVVVLFPHCLVGQSAGWAGRRRCRCRRRRHRRPIRRPRRRHRHRRRSRPRPSPSTVGCLSSAPCGGLDSLLTSLPFLRHGSSGSLGRSLLSPSLPKLAMFVSSAAASASQLCALSRRCRHRPADIPSLDTFGMTCAGRGLEPSPAPPLRTGASASPISRRALLAARQQGLAGATEALACDALDLLPRAVAVPRRVAGAATPWKSRHSPRRPLETTPPPAVDPLEHLTRGVRVGLISLGERGGSRGGLR